MKTIRTGSSRMRRLVLRRLLPPADIFLRRVRMLGLLCNFGHQIAVTTRLQGAIGDATVIIDSSLHDSPEVMAQI